MRSFKLNSDRISKISQRITPKVKKTEKVPLKEMTVKEMMNKMRKARVYEQDDFVQNHLSPEEVAVEQQKFRNVFKENNVDITFDEFLSSNKGVLWGGTVDNQIQWAFRVTSDENTSGIDYKTIDGFDGNDPENADILKKLEAYYDVFYAYVRDNILNLQDDETDNDKM